MTRKIVLFGLMIESLALSSAFASSKECQLDQKSLKVKWTAFKTARRIGVSGIFPNVSFSGGKGKTIHDALKDVSFVINTQHIETGDKIRDGKIATIFFGSMENGKKILGKIDRVGRSYAQVSLKMNDVQRTIPLRLALQGKKLTGSGFVDIFDFVAEESLKKINQACYALHEGKTWNTVEVQMEVACEPEKK